MQPAPKHMSPTPRGNPVDKKEKMGWITVDEPGVPYIANKQELHIDTTYQRTMISESRVLQFVQTWSWAACGSLTVAERSSGGDKRFWVVDGGHRFTASMRRSDIVELPCLVFATTSAEEEALIFFRVNCQRGNVSSFDRLRALLSARDKLSLDAVHLMESAGYKPSRMEEKYGIRCIAKFIGLMKGDRGTLQKVWPLIAELHGGLAIKERVFSALIYIAKYGSDDVTLIEWRERVLRQGVNKICDAIDRACSLYVRGGPRVYALGALEVLNKGIRSSHRMALVEPTEEQNQSRRSATSLIEG